MPNFGFFFKWELQRWWLVAAASLLLLSTIGCAHHTHYRTVSGPCTIDKPLLDEGGNYDWEAVEGGDRPCAPAWQVSVLKPVPFSVNFVEIDEQGILNNREQAEAAIANASREEADGSYVVVFVHGWHHNAGTEDANVRRFYEALALVSRWNPTRKIKGIYIGWRGDSLAVPGLRYATFWDRKDTSDEVGRGGLLEFLLRVERGVKAKPESRNRLVVIGHSFGASVTFNALAHVVLERFLDGVYATGPKPRFRGYGDLVVLINPAIEAMRYMPFQSALEYYARETTTPRVDFSYETVPRLLVLSSETDQATRLWFRAARFFSTAFEEHASISARASPDAEGRYSEWNMDLETVGNFKLFKTHLPLRLAAKDQDERADMKAALLKGCTSVSAADVRKMLSVEPAAEDTDAGPAFPSSGMRIRRAPGSIEGSPYVVADLGREIVDGHTDIGGPNLVCWINQLLDTKETTQRPLLTSREPSADQETVTVDAAVPDSAQRQ